MAIAVYPQMVVDGFPQTVQGFGSGVGLLGAKGSGVLSGCRYFCKLASVQWPFGQLRIRRLCKFSTVSLEPQPQYRHFFFSAAGFQAGQEVQKLVMITRTSPSVLSGMNPGCFSMLAAHWRCNFSGGSFDTQRWPHLGFWQTYRVPALD